MDKIMNDDLGKIPYRNEHGLSIEEQKWLSEWFTDLDKDLGKQNEILGKIKNNLTFIVIVIIVGIVVSILRGCLG